MSKQPNLRKSPSLAQSENSSVTRRPINVSSNGTRRPSGSRLNSNSSTAFDEASHHRHEADGPIRRTAPVVDDFLGADPGLQQIVAEQKRQSAQQRTGSVTTSPQTTNADENGLNNPGNISPTRPDSFSPRNYSYQMSGATATLASNKSTNHTNNSLNIIQSIPSEFMHLSEAEIDLKVMQLFQVKALKQQGITMYTAPDPSIELKRQLSYASNSTLSTITMDETLANLSLNHKLKSKSRGYLDADFDEELSFLSGGENDHRAPQGGRETATQENLREGAFNSNFYRNGFSPTHNIPPVIFDTVNDATSVVSDRSETIKIPSIRQKGLIVNSKDVTSDEGSTVTQLTIDRNFLVKDTDSIVSNTSNHSSSKRFSISRTTAFDDRSNCSGVSSLSNNSGHNVSDSQYIYGSHYSAPGIHMVHQLSHGSGGVSSMHSNKDFLSQKQNNASNGNKRLSPKRIPATDTNVINGIMYVNVHGANNINSQASDSTKIRTKLSSSTKSKKM